MNAATPPGSRGRSALCIGELFKFLSLATPTNGLFVECPPAKDPILQGLLRGNLGGQVGAFRVAS